MENKSVPWEQHYELQQERDTMREEIAQLKQQIANQSPAMQKNEHTGAFWFKIEQKLIKDPDFIKRLVRSKTVTMFDTDAEGMTLLHSAAYRGSYDIVQFCLNQGADINAKDNFNKTALDYARGSGYCHIEQLLLFATMNVTIGNEIKNTSSTIHKQNGINNNMRSVLNQIGHQSKQLFEKMLIELMINMINQRLAFDDILLNLCYDIEAQERDPLTSELWNAITSTCDDIVQNGNKRDWHWLKTYVLPSTLWYRKDSTSSTYLYYQILKIVNMEAVRQVNDLEKDLKVLANSNEHRDNWDKLTVWHINNQHAIVRQDVIPNGVVSRYTYNQLSESSGSTFNSPQFYDYNQYLSQLILLAQIVDDEFQASVQEMFAVDKVSNIGSLYANDDDDDMKENMSVSDGEILYQRGPVKLIERARNKAQTDYVNEAYPASACVVDLNRCTLIFNDISTMLKSLELFVNKVKYYQSGNIIGIIRDKNGFIEYLKQPQYADIKLNVLIKGKHNNIIGEVQFLLDRMKTFKDKAHNLYSIQRIQESIESSVSKILPLLLDEDKQLFSAGNRGNVRELCDIMVTNNKSIHDLMTKKDEKDNAILHSICNLGHIQAFKFLQSMMTKEDLIKHAFVLEGSARAPINFCLQKGHTHIAQRLFAIEEIQQIFMKNKDERYRLCIDLFAYTPHDSHLPQYILSLLKISHDEVKELIHHQYKSKQSSDTYSRAPLVIRTVLQSTAKELQRLVSVIGEQTFLEGALMHAWGENAIENAIHLNKMGVLQYMIELHKVKERYMNDMDLLYRMCAKLIEKWNESMALFIIQKLDITQAKLYQMQKNQGLNIEKFLAIVNN